MTKSSIELHFVEPDSMLLKCGCCFVSVTRVIPPQFQKVLAEMVWKVKVLDWKTKQSRLGVLLATGMHC